MAAIVLNRFRQAKTKQFYDRIVNGDDLLYLGIGRSKAWTSDSSPDTPNVSPEDELSARHSIQSLKKVENIAYAVPRYNWTSGNTYVAYDDEDPDLASKQYYVFNTSSFNVYICLKAGSGASTIEPTGTATTVPTAGADGYIWKYLYTISAPNAAKFLVNDYMPVFRNTSVAAAAVYGAIHNITIESGGSGYDSAPTITITGDGSGATATCTISGGAVNAITVTNVGSGYTYAKVAVSGGTPDVAATLRAVIAPKAMGREINNIDIDAAGATYSNTTAQITITGDGYDADIDATTSGGSVVSTTLNDGGYNYTVARASLPFGDFGAGDGNASLVVNFSGPKGGFGYDPVIELNAYFIMVNVDLAGTESGKFFTDNDYRQIVLIKNPLDYSSGPEAFSATSGIALPYLDVEVGGTWAVDDIIEGGSSGAQAYVVSYDDSNERIYYYQDETTGFGTFSNGEALTATGSGTSTGDITTAGAENDPEVNRYSGEMLYMENRVPVTRNDSQTESNKIVLQF